MTVTDEGVEWVLLVPRLVTVKGNFIVSLDRLFDVCRLSPKVLRVERVRGRGMSE